MTDEPEETMSISEAIQCGAQCSHCGVCFEDEHGYPVLCQDCFREDRGRSKIQRATEAEL